MNTILSPSARRAVLVSTAFAFLLRALARLYTGSEGFWVNGYTFFFDLTQNMAAGRGFGFDGGAPTAFRVPLYPIFLLALTWGRRLFLPVLLCQSLIGAGTVWCAAVLAEEMFGGPAALIAAAITAVYPYYVVHDTALQETSLFTLLTALSVIALLRANRSGSGTTAAWAGFLLGLDVLTRSTIAPFAVMAPMILAGSTAGTWRIRLRAATLCIGCSLLTIAPWLLRSYRLTGTPTLSTEAGLELWNGNNADTFSHYPRESSDLSKAAAFEAFSAQENAELEALGPNEAVRDRWFWRKGIQYMRDHPFLTIGNGFRKVGAAFGWLPSPRHGFWPNLVYALSYGPIMVLGIWGMWIRRNRWREDSMLYALFLSFVAVTAVFFGHTSHRAYLDVYWIVFGAGALGTWVSNRPTVSVKISA